MKILPSAARQYSLCVQVKTSLGLTDDDAGFRARISYLSVLLPYIEQTALYERVAENARSTSYKPPWEYTWADNPSYAKISSFLCPSDSESFSDSGIGTVNGQFGGTSYRCNRGDLWIEYNSWNETRSPFVVASHNQFGFEGITDGTSNTILLSEAVFGQHAVNSNKIKGGIAGSVAVSNPTGPPKNCDDRRGTNGILLGTIATNAYLPDHPSQSSGRRWADSHVLFTQFFTILPPNSPSCGTTAANQTRAMVSASSYHTGGVNVAMVDGAVTFVSETIQVKNLDKTPADAPWSFTPAASAHQYQGPAIWGVWSELGTRNGGENASLP
jgi:prepilin-type processing-associated H-X9-DG protein